MTIDLTGLTLSQRIRLNWWYLGKRRGADLNDVPQDESPQSLLIDGFESPTITGSGFSTDVASLLNWTGGAVAGTTVITSSTSNVTQGSNSLRINAPGEQFYAGLTTIGADTETPVDLTGYTKALLDITVVTFTHDAGSITFGVQNKSGSDSASAETPVGQTGSFTLEVDLTQISNLSELYFAIIADMESGVPNDYDFYIDNLRVE